MATTKKSPELRALVDTAAQIERAWAQRDLEVARGTWELTKDVRESAAQLLGAIK